MISVTKLDNTDLVVNSDLIEFIETLPETIICLTTGKKIMVRESVEEVLTRITNFRRLINLPPIVRERKEGDSNDA
jgi:flagellar protein FlbD